MVHPFAKQPPPDKLNLAAWQDYQWQCTARHGDLCERTDGLPLGSNHATTIIYHRPFDSENRCSMVWWSVISQHHIEDPQANVGLHSQHVFSQFGKPKGLVCKDVGLVYTAHSSCNG
jgi:hypothetical protein